ncbi:MAG: filamentous hemagglutinin N-terminal domain-containing protein, partial [Opitutus sp.]|nr:filamentous hemagglutinin N-terminal domain-containing protein [Opitutus sp.]
MNNKTNRNFSLRKLLLTALIAGPLATLPAPLWALPSVLAANLTTTSGVTAVAVSTTAINVTATAEKQVLTWVDFGGGASTILAADTINYFLPSASSSILNVTTGATTTTIAGTIASNGNVYVLNPNGIVLSATAVINTGGFYASTINEPLAAAGFGLNGTLSYVGPSTNGVTVNGATFQSVGTGNNVTLYGKNVDVNSATVYGNLSVNSQGGTAGTGDVTFAGASLSNPGAVTINK